MTNARKRRYPRGAQLWVPAVSFIILGALALWKVPEWLLQHWLPASTASEQAKLLGTAAQIVLLALGGVIAVIGVALSLARHGQALQSAELERVRVNQDRKKEVTRRAEFEQQRLFEERREATRVEEAALERLSEQERELRSRFTITVELMSSPDAISRTAGIYALGALADDWRAIGRTNEVQVCINVLCGYLRAAMPVDLDTKRIEAGVRRAGFDLIRDHLRRFDSEGAPPWSGRRFDLRQAPIWFDVDFTGLAPGEWTDLVFEDCTLHDDAVIRLLLVKLSGGATLSFSGARLEGASEIWMPRMTLTGGAQVDFGRANLKNSAALVLERATLSDGGALSVNWAQLSDTSRILLDDCVIDSGGSIGGRELSLSDHALVSFTAGQMNAGVVEFEASRIENDARLDFTGSRVSSSASLTLDRLMVLGRGHVILKRTRLDKHSTTLSGTEIHGGTVSLDSAHLQDAALHLPNGEWTNGPSHLPRFRVVQWDRIAEADSPEETPQDE